MKLLVHNKEIKSIFRVLGNNENALTAALSTTLLHSESLLRWILRYFGIKYLSKNKFKEIHIKYQSHNKEKDEGITDLEIILENNFHIIIEAKIYSSFPTKEQCTAPSEVNINAKLRNFVVIGKFLLLKGNLLLSVYRNSKVSVF